MVKSKEARISEADPKYKDSELWDLLSMDADSIEKLDHCGVHTFEMLAILPYSEGVGEVELTDDRYTTLVRQARDKLGITSGYNPINMAAQEYISTGSKKLDEMLKGGYLVGEVTEICGPYSVGKTNMLMTAANTCYEQYKAPTLFIHTEFHQPFQEERLAEIGKERGIDYPYDKFFYYVPVMTTTEQEWAVLNADKFIKESKCKLVIEDSLSSLFRVEYIGRGTLADRQQKLGKHLKNLARLAHAFGVVVLITNHVQADPSAGGNQKPAGGAMLHYNVGKMLLVRLTSGKGTGSNYDAKSVNDEGIREVTVIKAVDLPVDSRIVQIGAGGLVDVKEKKPKKPGEKEEEEKEDG